MKCAMLAIHCGTVGSVVALLADDEYAGLGLDIAAARAHYQRH